MDLHVALGRALVENGVETMFGVMGDGNMYVVDSFVRHGGGTYIAAAHEAGAVLMAAGYAEVTGQLGVATVTHGPGLTNTVTALVDAARARVPMVVICGDTPKGEAQHLQNLEQQEIARSTGAGFEALRSPDTALQDLAVSIRRALVERRPVVCNVPVDLQWEDIPYDPVDLRPIAPQLATPDRDALDTAVGILATARRPVILAGGGACRPRDRAALVQLGERLGAALSTTLRAKDLFRGEPADIGVFGTFSSAAAAETILESDCIVAFGASLNKWTTSYGSFVSGKRLVQCDVDPGQVGRFAPVDGAVIGDASTVATTFVEWLDELGAEPSAFSRVAATRMAAATEVPDFSAKHPEDEVDIREAFVYLDGALPSERTLVTDAGRFVGEQVKLLSVTDPRGWIYTWRGFGSIGMGMGTAIGAFHGDPQRPAVLITGDGGFMLGGLVEFNTAVRTGVDLIVVVINDGSYGAEHVKFRERSMDPALCHFEWPDLVPVARALGGEGCSVRTRGDLLATADVIANRRRPLLIDVKVDPDQVPRHPRSSG